MTLWHVARGSGIKLMIGDMHARNFSAQLAGLGAFSSVDLDTPMFMTDHPFTGGFEQTGASALRVSNRDTVCRSGKPECHPRIDAAGATTHWL